jgi:hypothetical protein
MSTRDVFFLAFRRYFAGPSIFSRLWWISPDHPTNFGFCRHRLQIFGLHGTSTGDVAQAFYRQETGIRKWATAQLRLSEKGLKRHKFL